MKLLPILCAAFFGLAGAAHAQTVPAGAGTLPFKERLRTPCGSIASEGTLVLALIDNATWTVDSPAGVFSGTLTPRDPRGRS
jgi:hypothetical protein